jgi:GAF domain-containing protein
MGLRMPVRQIARPSFFDAAMADRHVSGEVDDIFTRLTGLLFSEETMQSALDATVSLAREILEETTGAGVTLQRDGKYRTAAAYSAGDVVERADDLQYELNEGPCLSAIKENHSFRIDSMRAETRWAQWASRVAEMGMMSTLSVPLVIRGEPIGTIKVYSGYAGAYDDRHMRILSAFADQAAIVLSNVRDYFDAQQLSDQLREALETRQMIGQATGVIMEREGLDEEAAFATLRRTSQNSNVKLKDIARQVVQSAHHK